MSIESIYTHRDALVFYCYECNAPLIYIEQNNDTRNEDIGSKHLSNIKCSKCDADARYLSSDLRPVFPEERLLLEILLDNPFEFITDAVWANNNTYFVNGKKYALPKGVFNQVDVSDIIEKYQEMSQNSQSSNIRDNSNLSQNIALKYWQQHIDKFCELNKHHLSVLVAKSFDFIRQNVKDFNLENIVISFSGGKDSTVTQDLVVRALSTPEVLHIFGDTTLEFPLTYQYVERFKQNNPKIFMKTAKNNEQNFMKTAEDIGPPSRVMRWCCSMFKTGPITRILNSLYPNEKLITFYGIRACESVSRSKYNAVEDREDEVKISKQTVASPIFEWKDIEVWLYLLSEKVDFNDAYRYGWTRVGCWMCPNNSARSQFLSRIHMQDDSTAWRNFLIDFAKKIGKPDPEVYVDEGWWKARQGGNGLRAANDVKVKMSNCTTEADAKIYSLNRPSSDELINMFTPFGNVRQNTSNETFVHDLKSNVPIISISPFGLERDNSVKIRIMNVDAKSREKLEKQISFQILKYNACRFCLKCESLCKYGAISLAGGIYTINEKKCARCKMCVESKYLQGGCLMTKYLRTKKQ